MQKYCRCYYNPDFRVEYNSVEYSMEVSAYGEGWYTPGSLYRSNGDPGDPPDGDFSIETIDIIKIKVWVEGDVDDDDDDGDWVDLQCSPEERRELEKTLSNIIEEQLEEDDFEDPEPIIEEHEEED